MAAPVAANDISYIPSFPCGYEGADGRLCRDKASRLWNQLIIMLGLTNEAVFPPPRLPGDASSPFKTETFPSRITL